MTKDSWEAATGVMRAKSLISDLQNVTLLDESLSREQTIVMNMMQGLKMVTKMTKPGIASSFLHRELNQASQRKVTEDLKEITAISEKNSFATLPGWHSSANSINQYDVLAGQSEAVPW